jgi:hypothetical protein
MTLKELVDQYGPLTPITANESSQLSNTGQSSRVFTVVGTDVFYDDLDDHERALYDVDPPNDADPEEDITVYISEGVSGHHIVNVDGRYRTAKPLPADLVVVIDNYGLLPD